LDGKPVSVNVERRNGEEDFHFIMYDDVIFAPCDRASADTAECNEFFPALSEMALFKDTIMAVE
jgi:hypothetical protein